MKNGLYFKYNLKLNLKKYLQFSLSLIIVNLINIITYRLVLNKQCEIVLAIISEIMSA